MLSSQAKAKQKHQFCEARRSSAIAILILFKFFWISFKSMHRQFLVTSNQDQGSRCTFKYLLDFENQMNRIELNEIEQIELSYELIHSKNTNEHKKINIKALIKIGRSMV